MAIRLQLERYVQFVPRRFYNCTTVRHARLRRHGVYTSDSRRYCERRSTLPDKFSAADPLPTSTLKQAVDLLAPFIVEVFYRSLAQAHFPAGFKKAVGGRAFPVAGPTIWNSLPDNVISAPSLSAFRQRLKHFCSRPRSLTLSLIPGKLFPTSSGSWSDFIT